MIIEKRYSLHCSPSQVYDAWLSDDSIIPPVVSINSDPKPNGIYLLKTRDTTMVGKFLELVHNKLIKYSWHWEGTDEETMVTLWIKSDGDGTAIHLIHKGFNSEESLKMHARGWDEYVSALEKLIQSKINSSKRKAN